MKLLLIALLAIVAVRTAGAGSDMETRIKECQLNMFAACLRACEFFDRE